MYCKTCNIRMNTVYSFHGGLAHKFNRCPKCYFESKESIMSYDDIPFKPSVEEEVKRLEQPKKITKSKCEQKQVKHKKNERGYSIASLLAAQKEDKDCKRKKKRK